MLVQPFLQGVSSHQDQPGCEREKQTPSLRYRAQTRWPFVMKLCWVVSVALIGCEEVQNIKINISRKENLKISAERVNHLPDSAAFCAACSVSGCF